MRSLKKVLEQDFGLDLTGWVLNDARDISFDGSVIVGLGTNPTGQAGGWVAFLPEPTIALLLACGLGAGDKAAEAAELARRVCSALALRSAAIGKAGSLPAEREFHSGLR